MPHDSEGRSVRQGDFVLSHAYGSGRVIDIVGCTAVVRFGRNITQTPASNLSVVSRKAL